MRSFKFLTLIVAGLISTSAAFSQGSPVKYSDGDTRLQGYFAKAKTKQNKAPGIVIIPAWFGLSDHEKGSADRLAALGYHALAADIYGVANPVKTVEQAAERSGYYKTNCKIYQSRITSAINELVKLGADPKQIVVMGYCFGGTGALEAARGKLPVKAVISFHGGLGKDSTRINGPLTARVLALHGADDPYVPAKDIASFQNEMRAAKADWQMVYYANAVHAFTEKKAGNDNSKGAAYNELADKRSWEHMKVFLKELFM